MYAIKEGVYMDGTSCSQLSLIYYRMSAVHQKTNKYFELKKLELLASNGVHICHAI